MARRPIQRAPGSRMHFHSSKLSSLTFATAALVISTPKLATAAEEDAILDTIVVSASRREESIQNIPFNIAAASGAKLEQRGVTNLAELSRTLPGLFLVDQGPRTDNLVTVRGLNANVLGASEGLDNEGGGTVSTYVGDIPLFIDLKLFDINRVELLLGPQGTLYGAGTLGGAIRYLPNRPDPGATTMEVRGDFYSLSESDDPGVNAGAVFNLPLVSDVLALRAAIDYTNDPGFIDYNYLLRTPGESNPQPDFNSPGEVATNLTKKEDADTEETLSARVGLLWNVTDAVTSTLTYYYQQQEVGARTINQRESFGTGKYVSANRYLEPNEIENHLVALEIEADLGFAKLTSATGVSRYESQGQRDQTDLLLNFEYGYEEFPAFSSYTREDEEETAFSQEVRLVSQSDSPFNWIGGVFYRTFEEDGSSAEFVPGFPEFVGVDLPDLEYLSVEHEELEEQAVFGEIGYRFTDRWQATVGARYFKIDNDQTLAVAIPLVDSFSLGQNSADDSGTIGKINTSYRFTDDVMAYATVSQGYRIGGVNPVAACQNPPAPNQTVCGLPNEILIKPDETVNYEIGMRSTWFDGQLLLNGAVYFIDWTDVQVQSRTQTGLQPITVNGSEAESKGVELSLQVRPSYDWQIEATYAYNKSELTACAPGIVNEDVADCDDPAYAGARAGDRLPGSPEHQGNATLSYFKQLGNGWELQADYGITALSNVFTRAGNRNGGEELPGFALHRAAVSVSGDQWRARLHVDNLFNKYAETSVRGTRDFIRSVGSNDNFALRSYFKGMARPRTIGIDVSYRFDL